jgi:hypothetical protein
MDPTSAPGLAAFILFHVVSLFVAWGTRLADGSRIEGVCQLGFFATMFGIAMSACFCGHIELGFSVPSGVTLVAMVLMAVADFRPTQEPVGRLH